MDTEPKKQEPEIVPPVPVVEPARNVPEIPPDKDTPKKTRLVHAKAGLNDFVEQILIIVILVLLLGSLWTQTRFLVAHCSAACGIFALDGTAARGGALSVHQSHIGVVYGPRTR
jgi:hypothetical protein